jgi:hypothetical protein
MTFHHRRSEPKEAAMLCRAQTGDAGAVLNALNRVRLSHDLEPYWAPPGRHQLVFVLALLVSVGLVALI